MAPKTVNKSSQTTFEIDLEREQTRLTGAGKTRVTKSKIKGVRTDIVVQRQRITQTPIVRTRWVGTQVNLGLEDDHEHEQVYFEDTDDGF